jgi:hypothetical protein
MTVEASASATPLVTPLLTLERAERVEERVQKET